jgi:hypothetical protein
LQNTNKDRSLSRACVVLLACIQQDLRAQNIKSKCLRKNVARSFVTTKHVPIEDGEWKAFRSLYAVAQINRMAAMPIESPLQSRLDKDIARDETAEDSTINISERGTYSTNVSAESASTVLKDKVETTQPYDTSVEDDETKIVKNATDNLLDDVIIDSDNNEQSPESMVSETYEKELLREESFPSLEFVQVILDNECASTERSYHTNDDDIINGILEVMPQYNDGRVDAVIKILLSDKGKEYNCGSHAHVNGRYFDMRGLSCKVPEGLETITIQAKLARRGQEHPNRFISKWLPRNEPAARLALWGSGNRKDGLRFEGWLHDEVAQNSSEITATRVFKANGIVYWLEGMPESKIGLKPHCLTYVNKIAKYTSSAKEYAEKYGSEWD